MTTRSRALFLTLIVYLAGSVSLPAQVGLPFETWSNQTKDAQVVTQYSDGSWLMSHTIVANNVPSNLLMRITIKNQGNLFTNGTNVLELRASDFDANGIATIFYEAPAGIVTPKLCHSIESFIEL